MYSRKRRSAGFLASGKVDWKHENTQRIACDLGRTRGLSALWLTAGRRRTETLSGVSRHQRENSQEQSKAVVGSAEEGRVVWPVWKSEGHEGDEMPALRRIEQLQLAGGVDGACVW